MAHPVRASDTPFAVAVEQGKDYWWCACGLSKTQPFCDGSHNAAREFTPVKYTASESETVHFADGLNRRQRTSSAWICSASRKRDTML